ncbi:hypothetical protein SDC9_202078 [bioreactor metagenome]|uniref:Uncharacterized protein n=1 Tax=bioreactor metagenome TaxID=1076179 RepID=A0A645ISQ0_9ZZZZ
MLHPIKACQTPAGFRLRLRKKGGFAILKGWHHVPQDAYFALAATAHAAAGAFQQTISGKNLIQIITDFANQHRILVADGNLHGLHFIG